MADPVWLATAKNLPAGRYVKIECCAADKSLRVSNDPKGYRAYCFRCGPAGFVAHGDFSIDQLKRRRQELEWRNERVITLPKDFTTDIPPSEAVWLYKAGVGSVVAKHYGFGYSASLRRVILPIYKDGVLQGYTARSTINERPKYIERASSGSVLFFADPALRIPSEEAADSSCGYDLLFTEDILSAVRVGRVTDAVVCSLMGTSADDRQLSEATQGVHSVALWLDPDKPGRRASARLQRSLVLQGYKVKLIRSAKDPKFYSNRELRRFLIE